MNIYSDELLLAVGEKAEEVYGYDARIWRKDFAGAWIRYDHYGMKDSFGWQIDHKKPQAQGGTDNIRNLQPLQWENNLEKSDDYPFFSTPSFRHLGNAARRSRHLFFHDLHFRIEIQT